MLTYGAHCWHANQRERLTLWAYSAVGYRAGAFTLTL